MRKDRRRLNFNRGRHGIHGSFGDDGDVPWVTKVIFVPPERSETKPRRDECGEHEFGSDEHPQSDAPRGTETRAEHPAQAEHGEDEQAGFEGGSLKPVEERGGGHGAGGTENWKMGADADAKPLLMFHI